MKLLILSKNPELPSFKQRIALYLDILFENGIECQVIPLPHGSLTRRKLFKQALDFDGVLLHKRTLKLFDAVCLGYYARTIIYDYDDAVMYNDKNPDELNRKKIESFQRTVKLADMIITSNSYLAGHARKFNDRIEIVPTAINLARYKTGARKKDDKIRLVWIGGNATLKYLAAIKPALEEIGARFDNIVLRIICNDFFDLENMEVEKICWSSENEVNDLATSHIGLAPLWDDLYTRGKCVFKILQYAAVGLPIVASPIGVRTDYVPDGLHGLLATNMDEWVSQISLLIEKPHLREQIGEAGRSAVQDFDMPVIGKRFSDLIVECIEKKTNKKRVPKRPRKAILRLYNLADKVKFALKINPKGDLIIISGADSSHFKSLVQFIRSAVYYECHSRLVIYDLGLTKEESDFIKTNFPKINLRVFDYSKYPSYLNIKIDAGKFAWKPVIICEVLHGFKCSVIWLDAGCVITQPLYRIRNVIKKHGFCSPLSSGSIKEWTHPKTIEYLNVEQDLLNKRNLAGGIVAVDFKCSKALRLIKKWKEYALIKECTAPEGSSRKNHRHQSIMAILAYQFGLVQKIPQRYLGFKVHQDID